MPPKVERVSQRIYSKHPPNHPAHHTPTPLLAAASRLLSVIGCWCLPGLAQPAGWHLCSSRGDTLVYQSHPVWSGRSGAVGSGAGFLYLPGHPVSIGRVRQRHGGWVRGVDQCCGICEKQTWFLLAPACGWHFRAPLVRRKVIPPFLWRSDEGSDKTPEQRILFLAAYREMGPRPTWGENLFVCDWKMCFVQTGAI